LAYPQSDMLGYLVISYWSISELKVELRCIRIKRKERSSQRVYILEFYLLEMRRRAKTAMQGMWNQVRKGTGHLW
jgi:hypothetical protein